MEVNYNNPSALEIAKALAHPVRIAVLHLAAVQEVGQADLALILKVSVSTMSQHVDILESLGLVETTRKTKGKKYVTAKNTEITFRFLPVPTNIQQVP